MTEPVRFVVDASVVVKWLNQEGEDGSDAALELLRSAHEGRADLYTSDLAPHEVLNALIRGKKLRGRVLEDAVKLFYSLPLTYMPTDFLTAAAAAMIASEHHITFYDAVYIALILDEQTPLITANPKHQRVLPHLPVISVTEWNRV